MRGYVNHKSEGQRILWALVCSTKFCGLDAYQSRHFIDNTWQYYSPTFANHLSRQYCYGRPRNIWVTRTKRTTRALVGALRALCLIELVSVVSLSLPFSRLVFDKQSLKSNSHTMCLIIHANILRMGFPESDTEAGYPGQFEQSKHSEIGLRFHHGLEHIQVETARKHLGRYCTRWYSVVGYWGGCYDSSVLIGHLCC